MMPRVFADGTVSVGHNVDITGEAGHHFARVLRVREGEQLAVAAAGVGYLGNVTYVDGKTGCVRVHIETELPPHESSHRVYLVQGMAKGDKIDAVIQHNTELGVAGFLLFESSRSVAKIEPKKLDGKLARWQKIAQEAASQAQRDIVPSVSFASTLTEVEHWFNAFPDRVVCFLDEDEQTTSLRAVLDEAFESSPSLNTILVVGPEGGWDDAERAAWGARFGAHAVTLGPRTLRTETAGMVAASAVLHHFHQLGG